MYLTFVQEGLLLLLVYCCCVTTPCLVFSLAHCVVNSVLVHVEHCSHVVSCFADDLLPQRCPVMQYMSLLMSKQSMLVWQVAKCSPNCALIVCRFGNDLLM